jgi:hypothetical protein
MSSGGGSQTVGYRYLFGIHMGIGRGPVDELCEIKVGDKRAWLGSVTSNASVPIDAYTLFGGEDKEGGVRGTLEVMMGGPTQTAGGGLTTMLGGQLPGYRRMFTVFFDGIVAMINPYPKPWKFRVRRALQGWDGPVFRPDLAIVPMVAETDVDASQPLQSTQRVTLRSPPPDGWVAATQVDGVLFRDYGYFKPSAGVTSADQIEPPVGWIESRSSQTSAVFFPSRYTPEFFDGA